MDQPAPDEKPVLWVASAKKDLLAFPEAAIDNIGYALGLVQLGGLPAAAKPWKGEGPGVFEIVENQLGDTFRAAYTVRFPQAVYVLHCFQKKSAKTSRSDIEIGQQRFRELVKGMR